MTTSKTPEGPPERGGIGQREQQWQNARALPPTRPASVERVPRSPVIGPKSAETDSIREKGRDRRRSRRPQQRPSQRTNPTSPRSARDPATPSQQPPTEHADLPPTNDIAAHTSVTDPPATSTAAVPDRTAPVGHAAMSSLSSTLLPADITTHNVGALELTWKIINKHTDSWGLTVRLLLVIGVPLFAVLAAVIGVVYLMAGVSAWWSTLAGVLGVGGSGTAMAGMLLRRRRDTNRGQDQPDR